MTLRQWYKGMALAATIQRLHFTEYPNGEGMRENAEMLAKRTGMIADAMIAEDEQAIREDTG